MLLTEIGRTRFAAAYPVALAEAAGDWANAGAPGTANASAIARPEVRHVRNLRGLIDAAARFAVGFIASSHPPCRIAGQMTESTVTETGTGVVRFAPP